MRHLVATLTIIAALMTWGILFAWFTMRVYPNVMRMSRTDFIDFCLTLLFASAMALAILFGIAYAFFSLLHWLLTRTDTFKHLK